MGTNSEPAGTARRSCAHAPSKVAVVCPSNGAFEYDTLVARKVSSCASLSGLTSFTKRMPCKESLSAIHAACAAGTM